MNEFITQIMHTVTDPAFATSESEQVRERLRAAGLLAVVRGDGESALDWSEVAAAGAEAAAGTQLSELVIDGR